MCFTIIGDSQLLFCLWRLYLCSLSAHLYFCQGWLDFLIGINFLVWHNYKGKFNLNTQYPIRLCLNYNWPLSISFFSNFDNSNWKLIQLSIKSNIVILPNIDNVNPIRFPVWRGGYIPPPPSKMDLNTKNWGVECNSKIPNEKFPGTQVGEPFSAKIAKNGQFWPKIAQK